LRLRRETNGKAECNMFKAFGFEYHYVADGHSIETLTAMFEKVKDCSHPVLIHVHTLKGKGYLPAETHKEAWHWNMPFNIQTGENTVSAPQGETYTDITYNFLKAKVDSDKKIAVLVAGTPGAMGLTPERRQSFKDHYIDVGIAEEHAVAMSSALAKGGCKPVFYVWSSFLQRTYDQLSQDLAINNNPAVILTFSGAISSMDVTHLGCFDIPLVSNIPNLVYLAPTNKEEYLAMLDWAIEQDRHPVVIRVPLAVEETDRPVPQNYDRLNQFEVVEKGKDVAVIAAGSFFDLGRRTVRELAKSGLKATLINPRYLTGLDTDLLNTLKKDHQLVVTLENGVLDGGFGEKISRFYGADSMKVLNFGATKEFTDRVPLDELYRRFHLTPEQITADVLACL
jgi:1-deoxy-D-xylulose-5-phosphate synthase